MWSLFNKEISGFFSSLTGYIVIVVFIIINGLFMWVFPGDTNILDTGYSTLEPLFEISPWIFLFLIPAITMRSFAEEKKAGTLELLLIRPVSHFQIIFAKYLSALVLTLLALLPTLIYYISVILLGNPTGNIDQGATWGSYIGLFFLAAVYVSIGIFSSTVSDNIIVSFLLGVFLCFIVYTGFNYVGNLFPVGGLGNFFISLGIDAHYKSISRGVVDSRDLTYFLSVIAIFIILANLILNGERWWLPLLNKNSEQNLEKNKKAALFLGIALLALTVFNSVYTVIHSELYLGYLIQIVVILAADIFSFLLCIRIANALNRKQMDWGVFGFFFPQIALIIISQLRKKEADK